MAGQFVLPLLFAALFVCPAWAQNGTGGKDAAVTAEQVVKLRFDHYDAGDRQPHGSDFEWTFSKSEFVIKKGKAAIPDDLLAKLLSKGAAADVIRGKWALDPRGQQLILREIKAGKTAGNKEVRMAIIHTGVGVFRVDDPEYVFFLKDE